MKSLRIGIFLLAAMLCAFPVLGQNAERHGERYVFAGIGGWPAELGSEPILSVGGGGEKRVSGGFGASGEVEGFVQLCLQGGFYGGGVLSANGTYHFVNHASGFGKFVPFATAGVSVVILQLSATTGINFGGGTHYWYKPNRGIRLEFRDTAVRPESHFEHKWEFRTGFAF